MTSVDVSDVRSHSIAPMPDSDPHSKPAGQKEIAAGATNDVIHN
jgi:hypothetical protein